MQAELPQGSSYGCWAVLDGRKKAQSRKQHIALVIVFEPLYIVVFVTLLDLVFRVYVVFEYEREEKEKEEKKKGKKGEGTKNKTKTLHQKACPP